MSKKSQSDPYARILLDFLVNTLLGLIIINLGFMLVYALMRLILGAMSQYLSEMTPVLDGMEELWPTLQRIIGVGSIVLSLLIAGFKSRQGFLALKLPENTLSSQDVPNQNGFDMATRERILLILNSLVKLLGIGVVAIVLYDWLSVLIGQPSASFPTSTILACCIGIPVIVGLIVIAKIVQKK